MNYVVTPDILTSAKALGGGFPVAAMLTTDGIAKSMSVGTHGTTWGGNPLAGAVAGKVLEIINTPHVLAGVGARHDRMVSQLNALAQRLGLFSEIRGLGLLIGGVLAPAYAGKAKALLQMAAEEGLMMLIAGADVVRFTPSLIIDERDIDEGLARFTRACERFVAEMPS